MGFYICIWFLYLCFKFPYEHLLILEETTKGQLDVHSASSRTKTDRHPNITVEVSWVVKVAHDGPHQAGEATFDVFLGLRAQVPKPKPAFVSRAKP